MSAKPASSTIAFGDWLALHATGIFMLVFLGAHIWAVHYASIGSPSFTFEAVRQKLQNPLFAFLDLGLLCLAIYHGLVGLRRFIVDLELLGFTALRVLNGVLLLIGLAGIYYGWLIYRAFAG